LNQRPSGYEPDELPGCSTLHQGRQNVLLVFSSVNWDFCRLGVYRLIFNASRSFITRDRSADLFKPPNESWSCR
jgi:hypothetical protein